MDPHRIRLKAPWLVKALEKGIPIELPAGTNNPKHDLPILLGRLLDQQNRPLEIQATRRFHRPTGLTPSSKLSISVSSKQPPDQVLFGPIAPGEQMSQQLQALSPAVSSEGREYALPQVLQLRNELLLIWNQLAAESAREPLSVELLIREADRASATRVFPQMGS